MKKNIFNTLFIIIIIILLIIMVREFFFQYDNIEKSDIVYSYDEIIEMLDKGKNHNNYSRSINTIDGKEEIYYKNGKLVSYLNSNLKYWIDINNNEMYFSKNEDGILYKIEGEDKSNVFLNEFTQLGYYIALYDYFNFEYQYKGITKLNNRDTIVVIAKSKEKLSNKLVLKYYIDKETGIVTKQCIMNKFYFITKDKVEQDRNVSFDNVLDEKLELNLNTYEIVPMTIFPEIQIY